jgi:cytidylate kinase
VTGVPPLVLVTGPTAAGKTTIAAALAELAELERHAAPTEPILDWLSVDAETHRPRRSEVDRLADLTLLHTVSASGKPKIVESVALPMLLPVDNTALLVHVTASPLVRSRRILASEPDLTFAQARIVVARRDFATCVALRTSWGVDLAERSATRWRADLVVGCPHEDECQDEASCTENVTNLVTAAFGVYENYLTQQPALAGSEAVALFGHLLATYRGYVRRCTPLLIGLAGAYQVRRWQDRLRIELEKRAGLL